MLSVLNSLINLEMHDSFYRLALEEAKMEIVPIPLYKSNTVSVLVNPALSIAKLYNSSVCTGFT